MQVLKRTRADGGHLIGVSEMLDGVVVFQDERSADSFGEMLESDGHTGIGCAQCNSHELFPDGFGVASGCCAVHGRCGSFASP